MADGFVMVSSNSAQHLVHNPASLRVNTGLAAMVKDVGIRATGLFQRIAQNWHPLECPFFVDR
jgi:hypothetical protein